MARAHRVGVITIFSAVLYFLTFFEYISVPLLDDSIAGQILPVVSKLGP